MCPESYATAATDILASQEVQRDVMEDSERLGFYSIDRNIYANICFLKVIVKHIKSFYFFEAICSILVKRTSVRKVEVCVMT